MVRKAARGSRASDADSGRERRFEPGRSAGGWREHRFKHRLQARHQFFPAGRKGAVDLLSGLDQMHTGKRRRYRGAGAFIEKFVYDGAWCRRNGRHADQERSERERLNLQKLSL